MKEMSDVDESTGNCDDDGAFVIVLVLVQALFVAWWRATQVKFS